MTPRISKQKNCPVLEVTNGPWLRGALCRPGVCALLNPLEATEARTESKRRGRGCVNSVTIKTAAKVPSVPCPALGQKTEVTQRSGHSVPGNRILRITETKQAASWKRGQELRAVAVPARLLSSGHNLQQRKRIPCAPATASAPGHEGGRALALGAGMGNSAGQRLT